VYRRSSLILFGLCVFRLAVLPDPLSPPQSDITLPESVGRDLRNNFFMDPAMELLRAHRTQAAARLFLDDSTEDIQFAGSQTRGDEVSLGYVSRVPERFVSATLFFDRESDSISLVHVLISPGMRSRVLRLIDDAFSGDDFADDTGTGRVYLLGVQSLVGSNVLITLREQASELGPLYSVNYAFSD
jgi:hypothetical protein